MGLKQAWQARIQNITNILLREYRLHPSLFNHHVSVNTEGISDLIGNFNLLPSLLVLLKIYDEHFLPTQEDITSLATSDRLSVEVAEATLIKRRALDVFDCIFQAWGDLQRDIDSEVRESILRLRVKVSRDAMYEIKDQIGFFPLYIERQDDLKLTAAFLNKTEKARLGLFGRGRPKNSKTRKTEQEFQRERTELESKIRIILTDLCSNDELKPERKKDVAHVLKITPRQLYNRLKKYDLDWDQLLAVTRRGNKKSG